MFDWTSVVCLVQNNVNTIICSNGGHASSYHRRFLNFRQFVLFLFEGTRWRSCLRHCATSRKVAGSIPSVVIGIFHWHNPSDPGVDSVCNRNEYQEYFLEGKGCRCLWLTSLPPSCAPIVLKSGCLKYLEPSGPVQACNGIALPFTFTFFVLFIIYQHWFM